mgnify:CR=1 FL=1
MCYSHCEHHTVNHIHCQVGGVVTRLPAEQSTPVQFRYLAFPFLENRIVSVRKNADTPLLMSQKAIDAVFTGLFSMTDIRVILRKTAPLHHLSDEQKEQTKKAVEMVRKQLGIIEGDLL